MSDERHKTFWQSHECGGYRAKITIEWSVPNRVDPEQLPAWRMLTAEEIASKALAFGAPLLPDIVQAMRGYTKRESWKRVNEA